MPRFDPLCCGVSLVELSKKLRFRAVFLVGVGKELSLCPVVSCARLHPFLAELCWEHSRHFSASTGTEAGPPLSKCALSTYIQQSVH